MKGLCDEIIVVSHPNLPGYRITKMPGFTWGLIVRSRSPGRNVTAHSSALLSAADEYTRFLNQSREAALVRLKEHAKSPGRETRSPESGSDPFETDDAMREVPAYGPAVVVKEDVTPTKPGSGSNTRTGRPVPGKNYKIFRRFRSLSTLLWSGTFPVTFCRVISGGQTCPA